MASSILSQQSSILPNTAAVIAVFPFAVGVYGLFQPRSVLTNVFMFKTPKSPEDQKLVDNLIRLFAARDCYLGAGTLLAWYLGDRKMLAGLMLFGAGVVVVDGIVQKAVTGKGVEKHWPFVPVMIGIAAGLAGWLDGLL